MLKKKCHFPAVSNSHTFFLIFQPYFAAHWGAAYRAQIPPLMGLYPPPGAPFPPHLGVVPPFPAAMSPEQALFSGQQFLPHQRVNLARPASAPERHHYPSYHRPSTPRAESPHRMLRKNVVPPPPIPPPQFQHPQLPPGFPTNEAFPMLPPPLSPNIANMPPPPTQTSRQPTHLQMTTAAKANLTPNQNSPQHDSSKNFTFLKDGVHFPHVPSTPPPIIRKDSYPVKSSQCGNVRISYQSYFT